MTGLQNPLCARLFTTWGTALYVDAALGELRHGAIESSPQNAFLVGDPGSSGKAGLACLVYDNAGLRQPIVCSSNASRPVAGPSPAPASLKIVLLKHGMIGLRSGDLYLCAEPDGRVTLSRAWCSLWECFLPSADWGTIRAEGTEHQGAADATIDWGRIGSFTIDPSLRLRAGRTVETRRLVVAVYTIALNEAAHVE